MILKLSAALLVLTLAIPALAQTKATISAGPTDPCAATNGNAKPTDCPAAKPAKLGAGIIPLAATDTESGDVADGEDD